MIHLTEEIKYKVVVRVTLVPDGVPLPPVVERGQLPPLAVAEIDGSATPDGFRLTDVSLILPPTTGRSMMPLVHHALNHLVKEALVRDRPTLERAMVESHGPDGRVTREVTDIKPEKFDA